jgi:hypothetical protein
MNDQQQDTARAASYLATQQRMDLRGFGATRTGKTRSGKLNCIPPNVQCGGRCIPSNWDCRLKGQGTNSDLSAHAQDLLGGVASLQRGRRDLVKGVVTANPELINRGRNSLVRGAVKIAPGDNLQAKKRLKQTIQKNSRPIVTVLTMGVIGFAAHNGLKKTWPGYEKGAGKDLDDAVRSAYNSILDRTPLIAGRRAAIRVTGEGAAYQATRQLLRGNQLATTTSAMANTNPLRPGLAATVGLNADLRGSNTINNYDKLVVDSRGTTNKDTWVQRGRELVYGATDKKGNSIYSTDASAYLLTKQFGLNTQGVLGSGSRSARTVSARRELLKSNLTTRLNELSSALQQDMQLRGMGVDQYKKRVIAPQIEAATAGVTRGRTASTREASEFMGRLLSTSNVNDSRKHANELIGKTEVHFNTVFRSLASNVNRNAASSESPADEATLGFARFLASHSRGPAARIVNNEHADLYLEGVFKQRVNGSSRPVEVSRPRAVRVAKAIGGRATDPTPDQALEILRLQGGIRATYAQAPRNARPQRSLTAIARRIMESQNLSYAAALRQARAEIARRGDAAEVQRLGKPCGASHIPKAHECRKGAAAAPAPAAPSSSAGRTAATLAAGAAIGVAGLLAYRSRSTLVPNLSQSTIQGLSSTQVKAGLDKLPERFREPARQLVGDAKRAAAFMALRAQGSEIRAVDVANNFSTWVTPNGTHLSVGSVGDSLLTFGAERKGNVGKFPQYGLGFTIDTQYDAKGGMPSKQAKQLIRTTKAMYQAQLEMLPENAFLFAVPHKDDGKGGKRKSIYEGMGFKAIPGLKTDRLWALKNQGKFTEIPESQFDALRSMIRGDAAEPAGKAALTERGSASPPATAAPVPAA